MMPDQGRWSTPGSASSANPGTTTPALGREGPKLSELTAFKAATVSRPTAQHLKIENLRAAFASHGNVTALTSGRSVNR